MGDSGHLCRWSIRITGRLNVGLKKFFLILYLWSEPMLWDGTEKKTLVRTIVPMITIGDSDLY